MLEEIKTVIRAALVAVGKRIAPIEDDVTAIKADLADLKAFRDEFARAGLGDFRAEIEALGGRGGVAAKSAAAPKVKTLSAEVTPDAGGSAPVISTSPTGATVTVDAAAGTTSHVDAAGFTTTLDHATGAAIAKDAEGAPVDPHEDAIAEASIATAIAGVAVKTAG